MKYFIILALLFSGCAFIYPTSTHATSEKEYTDAEIQAVVDTIQDYERQLQQLNKKDSNLQSTDYAAAVGDWNDTLNYAKMYREMGYPEMGEDMIDSWYKEEKRLFELIDEKIQFLASLDLSDSQKAKFGAQLEGVLTKINKYLDNVSTNFLSGISDGAFSKLKGSLGNDMVKSIKAFQGWKKSANSIAQNGMADFLKGKIVSSAKSAFTKPVKEYAARKVIDEALGESDNPDINELKDNLAMAWTATDPYTKSLYAYKAVKSETKIINEAVGMDNVIPPDSPKTIVVWSSDTYTSRYYDKLLQRTKELYKNDPAVFKAQLEEMLEYKDLPNFIRTKVSNELNALKQPFEQQKVQNVVVQPLSYKELKINWAKTEGASGYEVYRAVSQNGTYTKVATISSGSIVNFTNSGLATGKNYFYKVKAFKVQSGSTIYSGFSSIVIGKTSLSQPLSVKAIQASSTSIKLSWAKTEGASGYEVYRAVSQNGTYTKVATISSGSIVNFTNSGLATGKNYFYKVKAFKVQSGSTVYSGFSSIVTRKTSLSQPLSVKAIQASSTSIKLSWTKTEGASGYEVYRSTAKSSSYSKITTITKGTIVSYINKNLPKGKTYYYKLRAYRLVDGKKVYSDYSSIAYVSL